MFNSLSRYAWLHDFVLDYKPHYTFEHIFRYDCKRLAAFHTQTCCSDHVWHAQICTIKSPQKGKRHDTIQTNIHAMCAVFTALIDIHNTLNNRDKKYDYTGLCLLCFAGWFNGVNMFTWPALNLVYWLIMCICAIEAQKIYSLSPK